MEYGVAAAVAGALAVLFLWSGVLGLVLVAAYIGSVEWLFAG